MATHCPEVAGIAGVIMPIYEYECMTCGKKFELRQSITDSDSEIKCPACGTLNPRRVLSIFSTGTSSGGACSSSSGST